MLGHFFPSQYPVAHISRSFSRTELDPDTGNETLVAAEPVIRYAQEISQVGKTSSADVISGEFTDRVAEELIMSVDDPLVYSTDDQVIINPGVSGGSYIAGTGVAYWVDGNPNDQRDAPWATYAFKAFGGVIHLRRVA